MCDFRVNTIECRGDGYCWDADDDGYDPEDQSTPCPRCNTRQFLLNLKEEAETTSFESTNHRHSTGSSIWASAVEIAYAQNPNTTNNTLVEIGCVKALRGNNLNTETTVIEHTYDENAVEFIKIYPLENDD